MGAGGREFKSHRPDIDLSLEDRELKPNLTVLIYFSLVWFDLKTLDQRASGVLCHLTSLPGPAGNGDLGPEAHNFVRWLGQAGQAWWQLLPIPPTGAGDSPYCGLSAFAGNPLLISLENLVDAGWLDKEQIPAPSSSTQADFGLGAIVRRGLLRQAFLRYQKSASPTQVADHAAFVKEQQDWLEDYALFASLKEEHGDQEWSTWPTPLRDHQAPALEAARLRLAGELAAHRFCQWQFHRQWQALRAQAKNTGVGLIGDIPIFVSYDSADVWAHRELFELDAEGKPSQVAGVPPDYFSEDGQLWGNPLYRWDLHEATAYAWWTARFWRLGQLFDAVRLDHFIGFENYWSVPAHAKSAKEGAYRPGPGAKLFQAVQANLGPLPVIAEDLGVVTPQVDALRRRFGFPGMKVLHFSMGPDPLYQPAAFAPDSVVYTGTHDNNTTKGWLDEASPQERERALALSAGMDPSPVWALITLAWRNQAALAIAPLQDLLELGVQARMNVPGTAQGNWTWRAKKGVFTETLAKRLKDLTQASGRA